MIILDSIATKAARSATRPTGHTNGFDRPSLLGAQVCHWYRIILVDDVQVPRAVLIHTEELVERFYECGVPASRRAERAEPCLPF